jgi:hypothetical protein
VARPRGELQSVQRKTRTWPILPAVLGRIGKLTAALLWASACARSASPPADRAPAASVAQRSGDAGPKPDDGIFELALQHDTAFGRTLSGQIRAWDMALGTVRVLGGGPFVAIAHDAPMALAKRQLGDRGDILEVWDLLADRPVQTSRFEDGASVHAFSATAAIIELFYPPSDWGTVQVPAPPSHMTVWSVRTGQQEEASNVCEVGAVALDTHVVCLSRAWIVWFDVERHLGAFCPLLAPEWQPPPRPGHQWKARGEGEDAWFEVLSALPTNGGDLVYFTYQGTGEHTEWRLERWTPDPNTREGTLERLASDPTGSSARLLAASANGKLLVLGGGTLRLTVRRAPAYLAEAFGDQTTNAVAISEDGARIVTGYGDGRMRLWDATTLRMLAETGAP